MLAIAAFELPEHVLIRDVLYVFQGIDGQYVHYDKTRDAFVLDAHVGVPRSAREVLRRLSELGWLHRRISNYLRQAQEDVSKGLVSQSFRAALSDDLNEFYRMLVLLENEVLVYEIFLQNLACVMK